MHENDEQNDSNGCSVRVTKYAEEHVAYGTNYFLKVSIGDGLFIHIRVHRPTNHDKYDFYALHEVIEHNVATCVFTESKNKNQKRKIQLTHQFVVFRRRLNVFQLLINETFVLLSRIENLISLTSVVVICEKERNR